jgi:hypothetical protein
MTTALEGVLPKIVALLCCLCVCVRKKDIMQRIFIKKCFLFTVRSVYRVKCIRAGARNRPHGRAFRRHQTLFAPSVCCASSRVCREMLFGCLFHLVEQRVDSYVMQMFHFVTTYGLSTYFSNSGVTPVKERESRFSTCNE